MRRGCGLLAVGLLLHAGTGRAAAQEKLPFADSTVSALRLTAGMAASLKDKGWTAGEGRRFALTPQRTVRLNDALVNGSLTARTRMQVTVKAAAGPGQLAVWLEWPDATASVAGRGDPADFADAVAVQFPLAYGAGKRLPHIGMGDEQAPVRLYLQRAGAGPKQLIQSVAEGFGSLTRVAGGKATFSMEHDAAAGLWRALLVRPVQDAGHTLKGALVPMAIAVFAGEHRERGGNKSLTGWTFLRLPGTPPDPAYVRELSYGYRPGDLGSADKGRQLFGAQCVGCHRAPGFAAAAEGMAPDLTAAGAILTPDYLRQSIVDPDAVVVRGLHGNRHYDKAASPDGNGAYPNAPAYAWSRDDGKGRRISAMPRLDLKDPEVADLVAYLKTLDGSGP